VGSYTDADVADLVERALLLYEQVVEANETGDAVRAAIAEGVDGAAEIGFEVVDLAYGADLVPDSDVDPDAYDEFVAGVHRQVAGRLGQVR
jgi:hypothetical protein